MIRPHDADRLDATVANTSARLRDAHARLAACRRGSRALLLAEWSCAHLQRELFALKARARRDREAP